MFLPMYGVRSCQILKLSLIRTPICCKIIQKQTPLAFICHSRQFSWASMLETQASWFKSLSESRPVECVQDFYENFHDVTGLPWWGSIIISTFIVRSCITLPLSVYQNKIFAKIENLQSEMPAIATELKRETAIAIQKFNWNHEQAKKAYERSIKTQWNKLIVKHNCHPFKGSFVIWVQLPMWLCLSMALRNMASMLPHSDAAAHILFLQLSLGGTLWIPNLTVPDASYIIPVLLTLTNLAIIEIQEMVHADKPKSNIRKYFTHFMRFVSVAMLPIAANVPACMSLYWTTSSLCGLSHNLLLMAPKIRRAFRIPLTPSENQNPYLHLRKQIKSRFKI